MIAKKVPIQDVKIHDFIMFDFWETHIYVIDVRIDDEGQYEIYDVDREILSLRSGEFVTVVTLSCLYG